MATKIGVLLTVFNRKEKTLHCLRRLSAAAPLGVSVEATLLDDGSIDGTSEAVAGEFPDVHILRGDGSAFWNGGMRRAWEKAAESDPDFYLWLNDDTLLDPGAIETLLRTSAFFADQAIIVGTTYDAETGKATYGGVRRTHSLQPLRFGLVQPGNTPQPADTMNGNCVLIPRAVYSKVGGLTPDFTHGMGDFDYGLRAGHLGVDTWVAPGTVGTCSRNTLDGTWQDRSLSRAVRWQKLRSVKGLPPREWATFTRRHGGPLWFISLISPYARALIPEATATR
jgi:GT2 family glycosyltransferase